MRFLIRGICASLLLLTAPAASANRSTPEHAGLVGRYGHLPLLKHQVQFKLQHPVVHVDVDQWFGNPHSMDMEADYYYELPQGATITGVTLWVNGLPRKARMIERQRAREIYGGIVNQKRDPALVERIGQRLFRIRIYPVLKRSTTHIRLSWAGLSKAVSTQNTKDGAHLGHYRIALMRPTETSFSIRGRFSDAGLVGRYWIQAKSKASLRIQWLPTAKTLDLKLRSNDRPAAQTGGTWQTEPIEVHYALRARVGSQGVVMADRTRSATSEASKTIDATFVATIKPALAPAAKRIALLLDISASMPGDETTRELLDRLIRRMAKTHPESQFVLVPFDLLPRTDCFAKTPQRLTAAVVKQTLQCLQQTPLRTSLGTAYVPVFQRAWAQAVDHIILVTDGATKNHEFELTQLLKGAKSRPQVTVSVLQLQPPGTPRSRALRAAHEQFLIDLARLSGGRHASLRLGDEDAAPLLQMQSLDRPYRPQIDRARHCGRSVAVRDVHAQPRGAALIVTGRARLAASCNAGPLELRFASGARVSLRYPDRRGTGADELSFSKSASAVHAIWAKQAIESLTAWTTLPTERDALITRIIGLSKRYSVVSEYTAFLATETDADYNRPVSGQRWRRSVGRMSDGAVSFQSTPEPHHLALVACVLVALVLIRRRRPKLA